MSDLMATDWIHATTTLPTAGLLFLLAGGGSAVAFLGWQTWRCRRWHLDIADEGYDADEYAEERHEARATGSADHRTRETAA